MYAHAPQRREHDGVGLADLAPRVPAERLVVAESGLFTRDDLARMWTAGARAFLIGESLMRQADVAAATRALIGSQAVEVLLASDRQRVTRTCTNPDGLLEVRSGGKQVLLSMGRWSERTQLPLDSDVSDAATSPSEPRRIVLTEPDLP